MLTSSVDTKKFVSEPRVSATTVIAEASLVWPHVMNLPPRRSRPNATSLIFLILVHALLLLAHHPSVAFSSSETRRISNNSQMDGSPNSPSVEKSTLSLLEHVNLNIPSHEYSVPFYLQVLGCGLDPRRAQNLDPNAAKKTIWANCGPSQFHLPYGKEGQAIRGKIGLRYDSLKGLRERLESQKWADCIKEYSLPEDKGACVEILDQYGNKFECRESGPVIRNKIWREQPIVGDHPDYGRDMSECRGIQFVEFNCPHGTAAKIAKFYEGVFDATTSVVQDEQTTVAIIAFGTVQLNGQAEQSLVFRELDVGIGLPPYDGHHIALYVGESEADFEQAFKNASLAGVVWVNTRFSDDATTLEGALKWKQFRFKNICDLETGEVIYELEHEVRSMSHEACPIRKAAA